MDGFGIDINFYPLDSATTNMHLMRIVAYRVVFPGGGIRLLKMVKWTGCQGNSPSTADYVRNPGLASIKHQEKKLAQELQYLFT